MWFSEDTLHHILSLLIILLYRQGKCIRDFTTEREESTKKNDSKK